MSKIGALRRDLDTGQIGVRMHELVARLYPICRSITGDGVRRTLQILGELIPITVHEVPTGTRVFDWTVPKEWNIRDAYIRRATGERVIDFRDCNLHVVGYSTPVRETVPLAELRRHLFSLPDHPEWIPYRTSYYNENWGFCMAHRDLERLPDDVYEVCIDSELKDGHLTFAECVLEGESREEVLLSCHICHPSLANDNLSGIALAAFLADSLRPLRLRYTYRFLFIPGTIGSITWLALNEESVRNIRHGLVVTSVGDPGPFTYKRSRRGNAEIDRVVEHVLRHSGSPHTVTDFSPYGYDERQYCSPGFDLPVGCLQRTPYGRYPEYHTSADNLDFVRPTSLAESLAIYLAVVEILEANRMYVNTNPKCEPQLGRRGLYSAIGGRSDAVERQMAMLWLLNLSDGRHSLLDIADRADMRGELMAEIAEDLLQAGLLRFHDA